MTIEAARQAARELMRKKWIGLTDDDYEALFSQAFDAFATLQVAEAVAAERERREAAERELLIANKKLSTSLANNLCSDHRDKQQGRPCLACLLEFTERQAEALNKENDKLRDHANERPRR